MRTETIAKTFSAPARARLSLTNLRGSVDVQPGEADIIQITAVKLLDSGDAERTEIVLDQAGDGSVHVETRWAEGFLWFPFFHRPCKVEYVVRAPQDCDLRLSVVSSRAAVSGFRGALDLSTVSGAIGLGDLSGRLRLKTVSGAVRGSNLSGPLEIETVSGDVRLADGDFPAIQANTVSGRLEIATRLGEGAYELRSVSGDVRLVLPPESACRVTSTSLSGQISARLPVTRRLAGAGRQTVEVQGGGTEIRHHSVSGGLTLLPPDGAVEPILAPAESERAGQPAGVDPAPPVDRRAVLERIASGELSADEGLKLLAA